MVDLPVSFSSRSGWKVVVGGAEALTLYRLISIGWPSPPSPPEADRATSPLPASCTAIDCQSSVPLSNRRHSTDVLPIDIVAKTINKTMVNTLDTALVNTVSILWWSQQKCISHRTLIECRRVLPLVVSANRGWHIQFCWDNCLESLLPRLLLLPCAILIRATTTTMVIVVDG